MQRLLHPAELRLHWPAVRAMRLGVFGDITITDEVIFSFLDRGLGFCSVLAEIEPAHVQVRAFGLCFLISVGEYAGIHQGHVDTRDPKPWQPGDGPAVLWVASLVSLLPGGAAKVIAGLLDQVQSSPHAPRITQMAAKLVSTDGAQLAQLFGFQFCPNLYRGLNPLVERPVAAGRLGAIGEQLLLANSISAMKHLIRLGRQR